MIIQDVKSKVQSHVDNLKESVTRKEVSTIACNEAPLQEGAQKKGVKSYKPLSLPNGEHTLLAPIISVPANPPAKPQEPLPSNSLSHPAATPSSPPALRHRGTTPEELSELVALRAPIPPGTRNYKPSSSSKGGGEEAHTSLERSFPPPRTTPKPKKTVDNKKPDWKLAREAKRKGSAKTKGDAKKAKGKGREKGIEG